MPGLGQSILEEGIEQGREEGIKALVLDNIEDNIPKERSIAKIQKWFAITKEEAESYYERFSTDAAELSPERI